MFSRFFIYRPIFASVISIVIVLVGGISIPLLPIESTPDITPPTVSVTTTYPGAGAEVVAETVAAPIEEEVNGVEDMIYMSSKIVRDGSCDSRSPSRSAPTSTWPRCSCRTGWRSPSRSCPRRSSARA